MLLIPIKLLNRRRNRTPFLLRSVLRLLAVSSLALLAGVSASVAFGQSSGTEYIPRPEPRPTLLSPDANRTPDPNDIQSMRDQQFKKNKFETANVERKRQLAEDSAKLLKMAAELKAEVDKTSQDTLSLSLIRKAEEIERLARNVQQKMKLTVAAD